VETEEKLQQLHLGAQRTIEQAEQIRTRLLGGAEEEVVELAMTIASKVIRSHVEVKRDTVVQLAGEALERAISAGFYTIFANPEDVELLREFISELRRSASGGARIHIISDASISRGGCKVETEHGLVDMTLESQLEQIRKALRDELERNG
jgi:flagellar assembly protein FliH